MVALWNISAIFYKTEDANSGMPVLPVLVDEASMQNLKKNTCVKVVVKCFVICQGSFSLDLCQSAFGWKKAVNESA